MSTTTISPASIDLQPLIDFASEDWNIPTLKHPLLKPVSDIMKFNVSRVRLLMLLPTSLGGYVRTVQRQVDVAEFEVTGKLPRDEPHDYDEKLLKRFHELLDAETKRSEAKRGTPEWDNEARQQHTRALNIIKSITGNPIGIMTFTPLLSSQLTIMWTALEALFADLWEAALNAHPAKLAALKGNPNRINQPNSTSLSPNSQQTRGSRETRSVPLDWIENHRFQVREKMGTILRLRFEFSKLSSTREAYACAFDRKSETIDAALGHEAFEALNAIRNVLVHKAGKADREYVKRCSYLPMLPQTPEGQPVLLNGHIVTNLIRPCLEQAGNLMIAVDDWVGENFLFPLSSFLFPLSSFLFPLSSFLFPLSSFLFPLWRVPTTK